MLLQVFGKDFQLFGKVEEHLVNFGYICEKIIKIIMKQYQIAVAGTGYVGLSIATLLAQHNPVMAVDIEIF